MQNSVYTIDELIRRISPIAEKYALSAVYLFGSYARGEATPNSDIDLLVDTAGSTARGLGLGSLYHDLENALGVPIDLVTLSSLEAPTQRLGQLHFRESVRSERVKIYEAA